ncbi:uncharacterized protein [Ptychodera flava]|uniref:uncharacterized protein n=1 Tax=Ptychodera flava TaxID=63121 RepID=UPI00396A7820
MVTKSTVLSFAIIAVTMTFLLLGQADAKRQRVRNGHLPICPPGATPNELHCSPPGAQRGDQFAVPQMIIGKRLWQAIQPSESSEDNENELKGLIDIDRLSMKQIKELLAYFLKTVEYEALYQDAFLSSDDQ